MRVSSLADYAVALMAAAARECGAARINAGQISDNTGIPLPTVHKLVSKLSAAGLLTSVRGAGGGFRLSRPAAAISLADVVEAIEGPIALTSCVDTGKHAKGEHCALEGSCATQQHWPVINETVRGALAAVPITSLTQ